MDLTIILYIYWCQMRGSCATRSNGFASEVSPMRFAHGSKRIVFQPPLGSLGRSSAELLNLTITETSSIKLRRANRNSQGSQRSWAQGTKSNKTNMRDRIETNSQSTNNQSINRSIEQSINQSINQPTNQSINQSIDKSILSQVETSKTDKTLAK